jgi:hypothetical protein
MYIIYAFFFRPPSGWSKLAYSPSGPFSKPLRRLIHSYSFANLQPRLSSCRLQRLHRLLNIHYYYHGVASPWLVCCTNKILPDPHNGVPCWPTFVHVRHTVAEVRFLLHNPFRSCSISFGATSICNMLELVRRRVLDGLNRRYIYGRVVSLIAT